MYRHFKGALITNLPNLYNVYKTLSLEKHTMDNIQTWIQVLDRTVNETFMHTTQALVTCLHWGTNCYWIQSSVKTTLHEVLKCTFLLEKSLEVPG